MGYNRVTKVSCSNPDIIASGSTFNKDWSDFILEIENGETTYFCGKEYLNDAIVELSLKHPEETFKYITWRDDDFESCVEFSVIIKNGVLDVVSMAPHYQILFPVIENKEYNSLSNRFREIIIQYLNRLDIVREDSKEGAIFDILNDKKDEDGFKSHVTITWENNEHMFTATKRYTSRVIVDYQKK